MEVPGGGWGQGKGTDAVDEESDVRALACLPPGMTTLMDVARLDTCVTVVDASRFFDDLTSIEELADRHPDDVPEGDMRNIAQLLVEQVEFADVILLNKSDTVSKGIHGASALGILFSLIDVGSVFTACKCQGKRVLMVVRNNFPVSAAK
eukprot:scaffold29702_cov18-Tisochrysis_lutea.AAC.1